MQEKTTDAQKIHFLYWGIFILAISEAIIAYAQSTYLNRFFNLKFVSVVFIVSYIFTFFIINEYPNLISRYNNLQTALAGLIIKILSLLIFIFSANHWLVFIAFIFYIISSNLIFINFDVFLEAFTKNKITGEIRGSYLTIYNLGWLISPFLAGQILEKFNFNLLFTLDILLTIPIIIILRISFKNYKNHYSTKRFFALKTFRQILARPNLKKIFYIAFLLAFFYSIMVVYTPLYLIQNIGLTWGEIGIIFTIMLLPFVLLQYPAGYLADKYIGEKELLTTGIILMAITSVCIFFITSKSLIVWAIILFLSRVGASLTEIMRESYFFKKVSAQDLGLINAFRSLTPIAYIISPLIFSLSLAFFQLQYIFLILGLIMASGLFFSLTLKDTK